jgi:site-specific DNA recombinase
MQPHTTTISPLSPRSSAQSFPPLGRPQPEPYIYVRVSTYLQKQKGFSLPRQFEICVDAARLAGIPTIPGGNKLHDADSGKNLLRKDLQTLLEAVRAGRVSIVYCPKVDRLGRNARDCLEILDTLHAHGVELVLVENHIDTRTPMGKLFFTLLAAFAEWEAELIKERTWSGKFEKMSQYHEAGLPTSAGGRSTPYGLVYSPPSKKGEHGTWDRHPEQKKWVLFIFEQTALGRGADTVAAMLDARGVVAPRGEQWNGVTVRNIVRNTAYIGQLKRRMEGQEFIFPVPPIVPLDLFTLANQMIDNNRKASPRNTKHDYLLASSKDLPLLRCLICHERGKEYIMGARTQQKREDGPASTYYRCDKGHYINGRKLEAAVWQALEGMLRDPKRVLENIKKLSDAASRQSRDLQDQLAGLQERAAEIRAEQASLLARSLRGKMPKDLIEAEEDRLETEAQEVAGQISLLHVQLQQARAETLPIRDIEETCRLLREGLEGAAFEDRRWIVRTLVDVVYADKRRWRMEGRLPVLRAEGRLDEGVSFGETHATAFSPEIPTAPSARRWPTTCSRR